MATSVLVMGSSMAAVMTDWQPLSFMIATSDEVLEQVEPRGYI